jgi:hypothetical protein
LLSLILVYYYQGAVHLTFLVVNCKWKPCSMAVILRPVMWTVLSGKSAELSDVPRQFFGC